MHRDQRRLGRIQATRDADHDLLQARGLEALHQALDLDVVDLLAALVAARRVRRHVREALDPAVERQAALRPLELELDAAEAAQPLAVLGDAVAEAR